MYLLDDMVKLPYYIYIDITRVLYFFYYEGRIILTNGFVKKTQETPSGEIKKQSNVGKSF